RAVRGVPWVPPGAPAHVRALWLSGVSHAAAEPRLITARQRFALIRQVDELLPQLPVAPTYMAAAQFLKDVSLQKCAWNVRPLGLLNPTELRVIQAADTLCTFTRNTPERLLARMDEFLPAAVLAEQRIVRHCELG